LQLTHYNSKFKQQQFPVTVVCQNVSNAPNIGSLFRACDAFGIEKLIFCGTDIPLGRKMTKTSRSTEKSVNYEMHKSALEVVNKLKENNYFILSLEISTNSQALNKVKFNPNQPIALIIGDENFGVSEDILKISDAIVHINMFGQNSSMNVVQATSITLYEITKQFSLK